MMASWLTTIEGAFPSTTATSPTQSTTFQSFSVSAAGSTDAISARTSAIFQRCVSQMSTNRSYNAQLSGASGEALHNLFLKGAAPKVVLCRSGAVCIADDLKHGALQKESSLTDRHCLPRRVDTRSRGQRRARLLHRN